MVRIHVRSGKSFDIRSESSKRTGKWEKEAVAPDDWLQARRSRKPFHQKFT